MVELIPVIRGHMGGRDYYIGKMSFQRLASEVLFFDDLDNSRELRVLDRLLQRELGGRAAEMTDYLVRQSERFYGAIIVAAWGGRPGYVRVKMEDHPLLVDTDFEFGLLRFDGRQRYFALDGQHRLKSIIEAIKLKPDLRDEEVSVVFVTHDRSEEGTIKTRRLFHTLNRYAKRTTTGENITLDEDNVVSIATRRLLTSGIKLFEPRRIELVKKNLTKRQDEEFTSLAALWDFHYDILDAVYRFRREKSYLSYRPEARHIENVFSAVTSLWNEIRDRRRILSTIESGRRNPGEIREPDGDPSRGNLLVRPIGLRIYGTIVGNLLSEQEGFPIAIGSEVPQAVWQTVLDRIEPLPLELGQLPWRGTIFRNNRIETGARRIATRLACYMLDYTLPSEDSLLEDYQGHLEDDDAVLPDKVATKPD